MARFGADSSEEIQAAIEECTPVNTKRSHDSAWAQFTQFCVERKYSLDASTTVEKLSDILKDYAFNMKRRDGGDYKETVIKTLWNTTAKLVQELFHKQYGQTFDPFRDIIFEEARNARDAKRRKLQADITKRKVSSAALTNEQYKKMIKVWDEDTPDGLQRKFYQIAGRELAWRGNEACKCLINFFKSETNNYGQSTNRIEYNPVFTKTCQGGGQRLSSSKWLTANLQHPSSCPVRLFEKLIEKRGNNITTDRLFLTPNLGWQKENSIGWFKNSPVGQNHMAKWTKESAGKVGLDVQRIKITNHSMRSTAVTQLIKSGIEEQEAIKITGHSSANSIRPYLQLDEDHHSRLVQCFREENNSLLNLNEKRSSPGQNFQNCSFNNCNFS